MAADAGGDVRTEERLRIKIGEAKNLPPRSHGANYRDVYCRLSLDQEEIFRTSTVERKLDPFFGEEFQFDVPRGFRYLSIYVFDRDRQYKQDKVIGKVAIHRDELKNYDTDHWFALRPVDADSEVQGKAHIEILFEDSTPRITNISPEDESASPEVSTTSYQDKSRGGDYEIGIVAFKSNINRKSSKSKLTDYCKENIGSGPYSSTGGKRFTHVPENLPTSLSRSESLRTGKPSLGEHHPIHNTYGPSMSKSSKLHFLDSSNEVELRKVAPHFGHSMLWNNSDSHMLYSADSDTCTSQDQPSIENSLHHQSDLRNKLSIRVLECSELTLKNGQCDPYAVVTVYYKNGKKVSKRTKAKKKTFNPKFDECFAFDLTLESTNKERESNSNNTYTVWPIASWSDAACEVCVSLWHDQFFLGEVRLPLEMHQNKAALNTSAWYLLGSRQGQQGFSHHNSGNGYEIVRGSTPSGTQYSNVTTASLGSLRLLLHHTLDRVLPPANYEDLRSLLIQHPPYKMVTSLAVHILGEIIPNKTDVAQPLVRLFTHADLLVPIIRALAEMELSTLTDATTIFRGNTLVSKMMDEAMKLIGISYLKGTIQPVLDCIFTEKKPCEIDPLKLKDTSTIEANLANLKEYIEKMFEAITQSFINCPGIMCRLFDALRQCACQKFPRDAGVRYSVVSGFIFLRFFAPAILGPRLFDIKSDQIDHQTNRTLTLISKTITTLGNLVSSRSSQQVYKEGYMGAIYEYFCTDVHVKAIKQYLDIISTSRDGQNSRTQDTPVLLKEGVMIKRTQRPKKFMRPNLKNRYFRLTNCELSYSKSKGKRVLCSIPLAEIVAAEPVLEVQNIKMNNMFQIVYRSRTLYVQASNCVERKEWLDLLGKLCEGQHSGTQKFHQATYANGRWNCCSATNENALGCTTVSVRSSAGIPLGLDPPRDLQRIHSLLFKNISHIEKILKTNCDITNMKSAGTTIIEDPFTYYKTLDNLCKITYSLEDKHRAYQRCIERETKYGSKQAPIGDDNYLHLTSTNSGSEMRPIIDVLSQGSLDSRFLSPFSISPKSLPKNIKQSMHFSKSFNNNPSDMYNLKTQSQKNISCFDKDLNSHYLHNSLYIGSSTESDKISNGNSEETTQDRTKSEDSSSGYLKMAGVRSDFNTNDLHMTNVYKKTPMQLPTVDEVKNDKTNSVSTSEYVHIYSNAVERGRNTTQTKNVPQSHKDDKLTLEEIADSPQYYCQEYELMSDFTTKSTSGEKQHNASPDAPPAIPPRNCYTASPSYAKYKKPTTLIKSSLNSHKNFEQYQLKINSKNPDGRKSPKTHNDTPYAADDRVNELNLSNVQDSTTDSSVVSQNVSHERSRIVNISNSCELLPRMTEVDDVDSTISNRASNIDANERSVLSDNFQHRFNDAASRESGPSLAPSNGSENVVCGDQDVALRNGNDDVDEPKEDANAFSRLSVQRKSIPTKSKLSSGKKTNSIDGALESVDGNSKSQTALSNLLTPSFFKRKAKANT